MMDFTFGIITSGNNDDMINRIIDSIISEQIPNYEIIIVGYSNINRKYVSVVSFNENEKRGWITKKKNMITNLAKYDNIVYLHDYIKLNTGWYNGQLLTGDDFKVRMDMIINYDGTRFRDWVIWPHNGNMMDEIIGRNCLIPYNMTHLSKYQYISGSYWVAKRDIMLEFPLDESLSWGQGEDVLWSTQFREKYEFTINVNSSVFIMKDGKDRAFDETTEEQNKKIRAL